MKSVIFIGLDPLSFDAKNDIKWVAENKADIWSLNNFYAAEWLYPYHVDLAFQIHEEDLGKNWITNYNLSHTTAVVCKHHEGLNKQIIIDIDDVCKKLGHTSLTSTFSYMFHYAWMKRYKNIRLKWYNS